MPQPHCASQPTSRRTDGAIRDQSDTPDEPDPLPEDRYINREQLRELIPTSDMTIARWQRDIGFPAPVKLGNDGRNYWWLPAIRAWTPAACRAPTQ